MTEPLLDLYRHLTTTLGDPVCDRCQKLKHACRCKLTMTQQDAIDALWLEREAWRGIYYPGQVIGNPAVVPSVRVRRLSIPLERI